MSYISVHSINRSKVLIWIFAVVLLFAGLMTQFFQAPKILDNRINQIQFPLNNLNPEEITSLFLENRLGPVKLIKQDTHWFVQEPRKLKANDKLINELIVSLGELKINRVFQNDPINRSNFNLDNPIIELNLMVKEKEYFISFGLFNSIDNSTYIHFANNDFIYQVENSPETLQTLGLNDVINAQIFTLPFDSINSLQINRYLSGKKEKRIHFEKKEIDWFDEKQRKANLNRMTELLRTFKEKKADMILDEQGEELKAEIQKISQNSYFEVLLKSQDKTYHYNFSFPLKDLPGIKIEKRKFILVTSNDGQYPTLIDKSFLDRLTVRGSQLRNPSLKKLFY